ncbi:unnamed protein product, partial [Prorocentrum cordatum]
AGLSDADARAALFNIALALPKRKILRVIALRAFFAPISRAGLSDADARAALFNIALALPKRKMLGMIALRAVFAPMSRRVPEMRRLLSLDNGSGLRVDGNEEDLE